MIHLKDVDVCKFVERLDQDLDQFMDRFKDLFGPIWTNLDQFMDQFKPFFLTLTRLFNDTPVSLLFI